jgi:type I restriction enzyme S subunit
VDRKLDSLCREITVGYVGPMASEYTDTGVTFLRSQNIRPFHVSLENVLSISREFDVKIAKSRLRPGDVAVVRTGYPGTAAVIPASLPKANCADLVIVRPGSEVEPQFLAAFFNSSYGKLHVSGKVVGAAQKHFNVGAAKETVLHLPPLQDQRRIIVKFNALAAETQRLESIYQQKLAALGELKKSLLHEACSGKL